MNDVAYTNFDYEYQLFQNAKKPHPINAQLSYLYYFDAEELPLWNQNKIPESYLSYLQDLGLTSLPWQKKFKQIPAQNYHYWWGNFRQLEQKKRYNSKLTTYQWAQDLGVIPLDSFFLQERSDYNKLIYPAIIKSPHGTAGRDLWILYSPEDLKKFQEEIEKHRKKTPLIAEKFRVSHRVFGTCYDRGKILTHENIVHKNAKISGIRWRGDEMPFNLSLTLRKKLIETMSEEPFWGVDSLVSPEGNIPLLECQVRRTLGMLIHKLKHLFPPEGIAEWYFVHKKDDSIKGFQKYSFNRREGVIRLAPQRQNLSFVVIARDRGKLEEIKREYNL